MEIERKFIVNQLPNLINRDYEDLWQGYISFSPEVRIRSKKDKFLMTIKSDGTLSREEVEFEITQQVFNDLKKVVKASISKRRYKIPYGGLVLELDVYNDMNLRTVEVEFNSIEESDKFVKPDWFADEITYISEFKNKNLASNGNPNVVKCCYCNGKGHNKYDGDMGSNSTYETCSYCEGRKYFDIKEINLENYNTYLKLYQ